MHARNHICTIKPGSESNPFMAVHVWFLYFAVGRQGRKKAKSWVSAPPSSQHPHREQAQIDPLLIGNAESNQTAQCTPSDDVSYRSAHTHTCIPAISVADSRSASSPVCFASVGVMGGTATLDVAGKDSKYHSVSDSRILSKPLTQWSGDVNQVFPMHSKEEQSNRVCSLKQHKLKLLNKLARGTEGISVMAGEVGCLSDPLLILVQLQDHTSLEGVIDLPLPIRFVCVMIGPPCEGIDYHEAGRVLATLFADEVRCYTHMYISIIIIHVLYVHTYYHLYNLYTYICTHYVCTYIHSVLCRIKFRHVEYVHTYVCTYMHTYIECITNCLRLQF